MTVCSADSQQSSSPSSRGSQELQMRRKPSEGPKEQGGHMTGLTSPTHLIALLLIALLLFGAKRLPEIGRSLGNGMREFKDSVTDSDRPAELPVPAEAKSTLPDKHETTV